MFSFSFLWVRALWLCYNAQETLLSYFFLLPWLSWIHRGAGLYIAVNNEPAVSTNVTEAKIDQKLLGILRVSATCNISVPIRIHFLHRGQISTKKGLAAQWNCSRPGDLNSGSPGWKPVWLPETFPLDRAPLNKTRLNDLRHICPDVSAKVFRYCSIFGAKMLKPLQHKAELRFVLFFIDEKIIEQVQNYSAVNNSATKWNHFECVVLYSA